VLPLSFETKARNAEAGLEAISGSVIKKPNTTAAFSAGMANSPERKSVNRSFEFALCLGTVETERIEFGNRMQKTLLR
jgi:hypothetical protein